jgi:hypothetical protein
MDSVTAVGRVIMSQLTEGTNSFNIGSELQWLPGIPHNI